MKKKFLLALFGTLAAKKLKFEEKKPNVIIIIADDYGYNDIGYHQDVIKVQRLIFSLKISSKLFRLLTSTK